MRRNRFQTEQPLSADRPLQSEAICLRPIKLAPTDLSTRLPVLGKVGSAHDLSLLRYRIAPAVSAPKVDQGIVPFETGETGLSTRTHELSISTPTKVER